MDVHLNGDTPTLSNYQLRLPAYEGPLDVLLRLIERSQLAIEDVSLVETLAEAPSSVIAEFATVGARLTVLKSRSLLPRPPVEDDEPEQSDLTYQLRAYKRVKELASHLGTLHAAGQVAHGPAMEGAIAKPAPGKPTRLAPHDPSSLVRSIRRRLTIIPRAPQVVRQRYVVSLKDLVGKIGEMLSTAASTRFSHVVSEYRSRTEVATAFLAVLVLVRRQAIDVSQGDLFSDITLRRGQPTSDPVDHRVDEFLN
jgi:segregation and condensation protein A